MQRIFLILLILASVFSAQGSKEPKGKFTLSGFVKDADNGEMLPWATIYVKEVKAGAATNTYGFYSISLEPGTYHVIFSFIGYANIEKTIELTSNRSLNINLKPSTENLSEVEITGKAKNDNITQAQMSVNKIDSKTIQAIPALMGEVDLIKALQLLPGVKFAAEGSSGFSVRGGSPDQNLVLLDEATVYNAGHLMGFFSVFNNDAVKNVELYKGDLPAKYGGRLSSLVDVRMKDGNKKEFHGNGGIGLISSRLTLEGPIVRNKGSFMISGRRSYADLFLKLSSKEELKNNILYFYDLNTKMNYNLNQNNHLFISGYFGKDVFKNKGFGMNWGNATGTARWNHVFNDKLFSNFTFIASNFSYKLGLTNERGFDWTSNLTDYNLKGDLNWYLNSNNTISFGFSSIYHDFFPGEIKGTGTESFITEYGLPNNYALENGVYITNVQKIGSLISLKYGLRISMFNNIGPNTVFNYDSTGQPLDSTVYGKGDFYNTYFGFEPRLGAVFRLNESSSVKASYSRNYQYLQQAQNSTAGSPLSIWFSSSPNIKPQYSDQFALAYFRNFENNKFEGSIEAYYKDIKNAIDFRDYAELLLNKYIEGEILSGRAYGYGIEFLLRKNSGKLNGWVSYTYSRTYRQIDGINSGVAYRAPYDRPHDISVVLNYNLNEQISLGLTWVYLTGQPITFPVGRFVYGNTVVPFYSGRNDYRMPDYHRLDLSFTWREKHDPGKKWHSELNFSIYNAYNRKNAWIINFQSDTKDPSVTYAEMTYLFGIIPSFTYNFKF
ncbi:MAG: TonB-dependent receptor [Chlorobi bacterium]|nr:TonB-dependent receptor [Chlorobiota bacterium]